MPVLKIFLSNVPKPPVIVKGADVVPAVGYH